MTQTPTASQIEQATEIADAADAAGAAAGEAMAFVQGLPWEAHAVMGVSVAVGLALWLFGRKLAKAGVSLVGVLTGAMTGLVVAPMFGVATLFEIPVWVLGLGFGAIGGLILSLLLLKFAVAALAGAVFALGGMMGGIAYVESRPGPEPAQEAVEIETPALDAANQRQRLTHRDPRTGREVTFDQLVQNIQPASAPPTIAAPDSADPDGSDDTGQTEQAEGNPELEIVAARIRAVAAESASLVKSEWDDLQPRQQVTVAGTTLAGLALGLLFGALLPKRSTAIVTAFLGSAMWLTGGVWLLEVSGVEALRSLTDRSPSSWAIIWAVAGVVGLFAQSFVSFRKKKSKWDDDEDDDDDE
ncbi:MAG: hypothetical protein AAFR38_01575 [Planctomycetota bacterium]